MMANERSVGAHKSSASTGADSPTLAAPCDARFYLADDRLPLAAKGLLAIVANYSYEQILQLERSSSEFAQALNELRAYGYVGVFDAEMFEVRLTLPVEGSECG